jgi:hypothetical protein
MTDERLAEPNEAGTKATLSHQFAGKDEIRER